MASPTLARPGAARGEGQDLRQPQREPGSALELLAPRAIMAHQTARPGARSASQPRGASDLLSRGLLCTPLGILISDIRIPSAPGTNLPPGPGQPGDSGSRLARKTMSLADGCSGLTDFDIFRIFE